jgi:hypothetical protein
MLCGSCWCGSSGGSSHFGSSEYNSSYSIKSDHRDKRFISRYAIECDLQYGVPCRASTDHHTHGWHIVHAHAIGSTKH